jgi:serine/threonine-protein kinase HipA
MASLDVLLGGDLVGRISEESGGGMEFDYVSGFKGPPVSQSMPVGSGPFADAECRSVFGGLLPEGKQRELLAQKFHVSAQNDFALLEATGGDVAGAIALLPEGEQMPTRTERRRVSNSELSDLLAKLLIRPVVVRPGGKTRMSLAGAQPKLPVIYEKGEFFLPENAATPTTHIIKPESQAFPGTVDNEAFCMDLSAQLGLKTARVEKRVTEDGLNFLLVERYDRDLTSEPIRRLHQEDTCQALGLVSSRKYQAEGGPSISEVMDLLRDVSAVPARDIPEFWNCIVLNWIIGNCDAHGKNFSLLYDSSSPTLAPFYDLVSTAVFGDLQSEMAMKLGDAWELADVTRDSFSEQAMQSGLSQSFAMDRLDLLGREIQQVAERLSGKERHRNEAVSSIRAGIARRLEQV